MSTRLYEDTEAVKAGSIGIHEGVVPGNVKAAIRTSRYTDGSHGKLREWNPSLLAIFISTVCPQIQSCVYTYSFKEILVDCHDSVSIPVQSERCE